MDTRLLEINDDSANLTPNPRYDLECPTGEDKAVKMPMAFT